MICCLRASISAPKLSKPAFVAPPKASIYGLLCLGFPNNGGDSFRLAVLHAGPF